MRRASCFNQLTLRICTSWDLQNSPLVNRTQQPVLTAECGSGDDCEKPALAWWIWLIIVAFCLLLVFASLFAAVRFKQRRGKPQNQESAAVKDLHGATKNPQEIEMMQAAVSVIQPAQSVSGANLRGGSLFMGQPAGRGKRGSVDGVGIPPSDFLAFEEDIDLGVATSSANTSANGTGYVPQHQCALRVECQQVRAQSNPSVL